MAISKVTLNGETIMDIRDTNLLRTDVSAGKGYYDKDGYKKYGTSNWTKGNIYQDENGYLVVDDGEGYGVYTLEQINELSFPGVSGDIVFEGERIRPYLFRGNTKITSFRGDNVEVTAGTDFGCGNNSYAFQNCTNLTSVSMKNHTILGGSDYIFAGCTKLETAELNWENMANIGSYVFYNCSKLQMPILVMPKFIGALSTSSFQNCSLLEAIDIGSYNTDLSVSMNVAANAFNGDTKLSTFIIRNLTPRPLANTSAFTNTCFASGKAGGILYVPRILIPIYTAMTNWSTIIAYATNTILPIEDSEYENYYADGTEVSELVANTNLLQNSMYFDPTAAPYDNSTATANTAVIEGMQSYDCRATKYAQIDLPTLTNGETYTLSFYCRRTSALTIYATYNGTSTDIGKTVANQWTKRSFTFTYATGATNIHINIDSASTDTGQATNTNIAFYGFKLEAGSTATPWTPAPTS